MLPCMLFCHWVVRQTVSNLNSFYFQTVRQPTGQHKQDRYKVLGQCGSKEPCQKLVHSVPCIHNEKYGNSKEEDIEHVV
jgi:hypothetical protein